MKSHVKTNVYWFTESSPNIHVHPSIGSKVTVAFSIDLAIGWDKNVIGNNSLVLKHTAQQFYCFYPHQLCPSYVAQPVPLSGTEH